MMLFPVDTVGGLCWKNALKIIPLYLDAKLATRGIFLFGKLRSLLRRESIEDTVPFVILKLENSLNRLDQISVSLKNEDNALFEKCIEARLRNDAVHALMYANECAEIRKIALLVVSSKYALEQMVLRLHTVTKLGSILVTVSPLIGVIKETRSRLVGIVPSVANNLNEANSILSKCLTNMGTSTVSDNTPNIVCSEEAMRVLEEANNAAEKTIREKFPKIPGALQEQARPRTSMIRS